MRTAFRYLLLLTLLAACAPVAPAAPTLPPAQPGPHGLGEPFLSAWRGAGGEDIGAPRTPPLWIDDYQVQLFAGHQIVAVDGSHAVVEPLAAGWEARYPADLLALPAAAQRASIALADGQSALARPLAPLSLLIRAPGYSGPARLQLYDAELRPAGGLELLVADGRAGVELLPRGRLGPQWASLTINGQTAGARAALFTLEAVTELHSGQADLDALVPRLGGFLAQDVVTYELNGAPVRGYRSPDNPLLWLRDHV